MKPVTLVTEQLLVRHLRLDSCWLSIVSSCSFLVRQCLTVIGIPLGRQWKKIPVRFTTGLILVTRNTSYRNIRECFPVLDGTRVLAPLVSYIRTVFDLKIGKLLVLRLMTVGTWLPGPTVRH